MIHRMAWGTLLLFIYMLSAFLAAGAGHGTTIFFAPLMPYGFGAIVYLFAFYLTEYLSSNWIRIIFVSVLLVNYLGASIFVDSWWNDDYPYLVKTWSISPVYILLPLGLIIGANVYLWYRFVASYSQVSEELDNN